MKTAAQIAKECSLPNYVIYNCIRNYNIKGVKSKSKKDRNDSKFYDKYQEDLIHKILNIKEVIYESKINKRKK